MNTFMCLTYGLAFLCSSAVGGLIGYALFHWIINALDRR